MNYEQELKNKQLSQFKEAPSFNKWLEIYAKQLQDIEDAGQSIIDHLHLADVGGVVLDRFGYILGTPKRTVGMNDNTYRGLNYGQILLNIYQGTRQELLQFFKLLGATSVIYKEYYPAKVEIQYNNISPAVLSPTTIKNMLIKATHPIGWEISYFTDAPFVFEGDSTGFGFDVGELGTNY
jgi:hypothetical protein